jgi:hypothetical protein
MSAQDRAAYPRARISLTQFTNIYAPFALLVCLALLVPEVTQNLDQYRTILTIWVTIILLTPALCCFVFSDVAQSAYNYWLLLWTFIYLAYLLHFYWAVFVVFRGIRGTFAGQGNVIAGTNFLLTAWWALDVLLSWLLTSHNRWLWVERVCVHAFVFAVFVVTTLFLRPTPVSRSLGLILAIAVTVCIVVRLFSSSRRVFLPERHL